MSFNSQDASPAIHPRPATRAPGSRRAVAWLSGGRGAVKGGGISQKIETYRGGGCHGGSGAQRPCRRKDEGEEEEEERERKRDEGAGTENMMMMKNKYKNER